MNSNYLRLVNVSLQGTNLAFRFLFVFFLARYLDPAFVGTYGLFSALVGYSLYCVGLDFYTFSTREVAAGRMPPGAALKHQLVLAVGLYFLFIPLSFLGFKSQFLQFELFYYFIPIVVLEHLNQETFRFLIALSKPLFASMLLFVRQASWAIVSVAFMYFYPELRSLEFVLSCWLLAGLAALSLGMLKIHVAASGGWSTPLDWKWIKRGMSVCGLLLIGTLALRGLLTLDRYLLAALDGLEIVGSYVLFISVASTLSTFLDASVFSFSYPKLIKMKAAGEFENFKKTLVNMAFQTAGLCVFFAVASYFLLPILLSWIGNEFYLNHLYLYPWLLLAMVFNALSLLPHYALYAWGADRFIVFSHVGSFLVFVISVWLLRKPYADASIPLALNLAFFSLLLGKCISLVILKRSLCFR